MEHCTWGSPTNPSECTAATVAVVGNRLLACIEDSHLTRTKKELFKTSHARKWVLQRAEEFGFSENEVNILCCDGLTNEEHSNFIRMNPNLNGVYKGHYLAKQYRSHHLRHALNAYFQSGYKDAAILVLDGCDYPGGTSIALFEGIGNKITLKKSWPTTKSLGLWYAYGCVSCGFKWYHPGKLMAASSFAHVPDDINKYYDSSDLYIPNASGRLEIYRDLKQPIPKIFKSLALHLAEPMIPCKFNLTNYKDGAPEIDIHHNSNFYDIIGVSKGLPITPEKFDFRFAARAASFQYFYSCSVHLLLAYAASIIDSRNLVMGGGCASNVITTGEIIRSKVWDNVFIPPMHDDSGNAVGAAIERFNIELKEPLVYNKYTYNKPREWNKEVSAKELADKIHKGQIVAWFEGGSEYGPRALCHRSILANPCFPYMAYRLNEIKNREYWRPFAPVVLDTHFKKFFDVDGRIWEPHKYMLATEYIKPEYRTKYRNVLAPDGSSRPQVLTENKYNRVLYSLMRDNNLPLLINTSMNDRGEPICETPEDAINFARKNDDVLLVFVQNDKIYCK